MTIMEYLAYSPVGYMFQKYLETHNVDTELGFTEWKNIRFDLDLPCLVNAPMPIHWSHFYIDITDVGTLNNRGKCIQYEIQ